MAQPSPAAISSHDNDEEASPKGAKAPESLPVTDELVPAAPDAIIGNDEVIEVEELNVQLKNVSMSTLSILLTTISIALAFTYVILRQLRQLLRV